MDSIILADEILPGSEPGRLTALEQVGGLSLLERYLRLLRKSSVTSICVVVPGDRESDPEVIRAISQAGVEASVKVWETAPACFDGEGDILVIASDYYVERQFIEYLIDADRPCLPVQFEKDTTVPQSIGCARIRKDTLLGLTERGVRGWDGVFRAVSEEGNVALFDTSELPTYQHPIRRHRTSRWLRVRSPRDLDTAHRWVIDSAQKGSLDIPAKILHAPIENAVVSWLCRYSITPNQVTFLTNIAAWSVTFGFLSGWLWTSLVGAALVGIMDGLDGKLARAKLMTSKVGELEHLGDMLFEYSWWLSLGWVLGGGSGSPEFQAGLWLVTLSVVDVVLGVVFWLAIGRKHNRTLDNFSSFELAVRGVSGRRNIYIWLMLLSGPFLGLSQAMWLCVVWGFITIGIRVGRAFWLGGAGRAPEEFVF